MKIWKEAASLLVACRARVNPTPLSAPLSVLPNPPDAREDYKLLMMMRHSKTPFMPSKMVFPGGALSEADKHPDWESLFQRLAGPAYQRFLHKLTSAGSVYPVIEANRHSTLPADVIFRICAIRETFEETGLLLVVGGDGNVKEDATKNSRGMVAVDARRFCGVSEGLQREVGGWRKKVAKDAGQFMEMCVSLQVLPDVWSLYEWNNWLTPVFRKKSVRFDTMFYLCCLHSHAPLPPPVESDNYESTKLEWAEPSAFLDQHPEVTLAEPSFAPPQAYELADLKHHTTLESLQQEAYSRTFTHRPRVRLLPAFRYLKDAYLTLFPGDHLYEQWIAEEGVFEVEGVSLDSFQGSQGPQHRVFYNRQHPNGHMIRTL